MRNYPKRAQDFRESITPPRTDKNRKHFGEFSKLQKDLAAGPFKDLRKISAVRAAGELNDFMRQKRNGIAPKQVYNQLEKVRRLACELSAAVDDLHGVSASILLGVDDPTAPYLSRPRGSEPSNNKLDEQYKVAFEPYLQALAAIEAREASPARQWSPQLARETNDEVQLAVLDRYDRARSARSHHWRSMNQGLQWDEYETSDKGFEAWRGPPAREVLLDPLRDQIEALGVIAGTARDAVSSWPTLRGSEALAADAWEVTYMKICWRCIQDEFGDAKSDDLSADREADEFLIFIRAMAKFASGFHRVESHFGASVKEVLAWGKTQAKQESKSRKFLQTGEPPEGGTAPRI